MLTVAVQQKRRRRRKGPDVGSIGCGTVQRRITRCIKYANLLRPDWKVLPDTVVGDVTQFTRHHTNPPANGVWRVLISIPGIYVYMYIYTSSTKQPKVTYTNAKVGVFARSPISDKR